MKTKLTWSQTQYPINWSNNPYIWSDVAVLIEAIQVISGGGPSGDFNQWQQKNPEKKKILIKLMVTIDGLSTSAEKYKNENDF